MASQRILLPYNFTPLDRKALSFVVDTYAGKDAATITLLNLYTPVPEIDTSKLSVMGNLQGSLNYLRQKIVEQEEALNSVHHELIESGFGEESVQLIFKARNMDIANEIMELVKVQGHNVIVLNHKSGKVSRFFTGSVFAKLVTSLRDITISIVT